MSWLLCVHKWKKTRRNREVNFSIQKEESYTSIKVLNEKLDSLLAPGFKSELVVIVENGEKNILVDLSNCKSCDSSGMSVLSFGNRLCNGANGKFVLYGLTNKIKEMMDLIGFDSLLSVTHTKAEAKKLFL